MPAYRRRPVDCPLRLHGSSGRGRIGDAEPLDGCFWIADTGGRIGGNHFDLFVGDDVVYSDFLHHQKRKATHHRRIYRLPDPLRGFSPRTSSGLAAILHSTGRVETTDGITPGQLKGALVDFQKNIRYIPPAENGEAHGAVTLWFLTQAALEAKNSAASGPMGQR